MLEYLIGFISEYFSIIILFFVIATYLSIILRSFRNVFVTIVIMSGLYLLYAWLWRNGIGYEPLYLFTMNIIYSAMQMFERIIDIVKTAEFSLFSLYMIDATISLYIVDSLGELTYIDNYEIISCLKCYLQSFLHVRKLYRIELTKTNNKVDNVYVEKNNIFPIIFILRC